MAGLPDCFHCPFRDDPETACAVIESKATRLCRKVDPSSDIHDPRMVAAVRRLTLEPLGRWEEPGFPPLLEQSRNLAGAVVAAVASGGKQASPEEQARRLAICSSCPEFVNGRCRKCGCFTNFKVQLEAWHCPIKKW